MDKILLCTNYDREDKIKSTYEIADTLDSLGYEIYIMASGYDDSEHNEKYKFLYTNDEIITENIKLAICIGGDGTILGFARRFTGVDISLIGLNLGSLGFLAELSMNNYERLFRELKEGKETYKIEERTGLLIEYEGKETSRNFALNDVVVSRKSGSKIITIEVYINGIYVDAYLADGVLISTATGSTGYNLSAGGPILLPQSTNVILTPVCAHSLRNRSIVFTKDDIITLKLSSEKDKNTIANVTVDGQVTFDMDTEAYLNIRAKGTTNKFFVFDEEIFFRKLRDKIR